MVKSVSVIGAGSWGTALALLLARNGHRVMLWGHDAGHMAVLQQDRSNQHYLPGFAFPDTLTVTADLAEAVNASPILLIVVPSHAFRDLLP